jgi:hypothetical protein
MYLSREAGSRSSQIHAALASNLGQRVGPMSLVGTSRFAASEAHIAPTQAIVDAACGTTTTKFLRPSVLPSSCQSLSIAFDARDARIVRDVGCAL